MPGPEAKRVTVSQLLDELLADYELHGRRSIKGGQVTRQARARGAYRRYSIVSEQDIKAALVKTQTYLDTLHQASIALEDDQRALRSPGLGLTGT